MEVLEHFENSDDFFYIIKKHLSPKGKIILSCPNNFSIYKPKTDYPPHHFARFSPSSLTLILKKHGFHVELLDQEFSLFQLIRNIIGDFIRKEKPLIKYGVRNSDSKRIIYLKKLANNLRTFLNFFMMPIDLFFKKLGFCYISQFVVANSID